MKKNIFVCLLLLFTTISFAQDKIEEVTVSKELKVGTEVPVSVTYVVSEKRNMRVFVQLNEDPWTTVSSEAQLLKEGTNQADFVLKIPQDAKEGSNYKVVVSLAPLRKGWPDRLDDYSIMEVVISK